MREKAFSFERTITLIVKMRTAFVGDTVNDAFDAADSYRTSLIDISELLQSGDATMAIVDETADYNSARRVQLRRT